MYSRKKQPRIKVITERKLTNEHDKMYCELERSKKNTNILALRQQDYNEEVKVYVLRMFLVLQEQSQDTGVVDYKDVEGGCFIQGYMPAQVNKTHR
jgi:hypothetical protein